MGQAEFTADDLKALERVTAKNLIGKDFSFIISEIIPYLFTAAGIILLLYLISAGFGFLTSAGDPKKTEAAKGKITTALIGFLIVFFAYLIVRFVALIFSAQPVLDIF